MNCFEWQYISSDHLDGTLIASKKREADEHLETCEPCKERYTRYRLILTTFSSQPRAALPIAIRKAPLDSPVSPTPGVPQTPASNARTSRAQKLAKLSPASLWPLWKELRTRWDRIPWYLRTTLEGVGIVFLILVGISTGPRLRNMYERSVQRSLEEYNDVLNETGTGDASVPAPARIASSGLASGSGGQGATATGAAMEDEYSGGESGSSRDDEEIEGENELGDETSGPEAPETQDIRVGNSQIWRFNLKTDSPRDYQKKIVQILKDLGVKENNAGLEAPGGIQFDLLVPKSVIPGLKREIEKIAPASPEGTSRTPFGETFTWYKNRSRNKIPDGKTRVVIWLSQM